MKTDEQKAAALSARDKNPAILKKRELALAQYVISPGQHPNPDPFDWRKPAVTDEELRLSRLVDVVDDSFPEGAPNRKKKGGH